MSLALQGGFFTTGPPGKPLSSVFLMLSNWIPNLGFLPPNCGLEEDITRTVTPPPTPDRSGSWPLSWGCLISVDLCSVFWIRCSLQQWTWRRKWQPTPVFLPGISHGQSSLAGYSPWGHKELGRTDRACVPTRRQYSKILEMKLIFRIVWITGRYSSGCFIKFITFPQLQGLPNISE